MTFLDTGIMVGAVLKLHPEHEVCLAALEDSVRPFTNAYAFGLKPSPPSPAFTKCPPTPQPS